VKLTDWVKHNCIKYGTEIEWITDQSEEGSKFSSGFGIGAILRYPVNSLPSKKEENNLAFHFSNST